MAQSVPCAHSHWFEGKEQIQRDSSFWLTSLSLSENSTQKQNAAGLISSSSHPAHINMFYRSLHFPDDGLPNCTPLLVKLDLFLDTFNFGEGPNCFQGKPQQLALYSSLSFTLSPFPTAVWFSIFASASPGLHWARWPRSYAGYAFQSCTQWVEQGRQAKPKHHIYIYIIYF